MLQSQRQKIAWLPSPEGHVHSEMMLLELPSVLDFIEKKQSESELADILGTLPGYTVPLEKQGHLVCISPQMQKE